jgi:hypothetical protein
MVSNNTIFRDKIKNEAQNAQYVDIQFKGELHNETQ